MSGTPVDSAHNTSNDPTDTIANASLPPTKPSTSSHPPAGKSDPTVNVENVAQGGLSSSATSGSSELASLKVGLRNAVRQFPDFPSPGILFEDIMPIFADPKLHESLIRALELHVRQTHQQLPDVIIGLEARGFLFGPSLALRLGAGFVPVRKKGKLPGPCETESYVKEYGEDFFQMQADGVKPGQTVVVVDDLIATGGSAAAAGGLVKKLGGTLLGYIFILELDFLKGREKLDAPIYTLLSSQ